MTKVSQTLLTVDVRDMGRSLSAEGVGTTFGRGTTTACFHCHGTVPDDNEELSMSQAGVLISKANSVRILLGIVSGPGTVYVFTWQSSSTSVILLHDLAFYFL